MLNKFIVHYTKCPPNAVYFKDLYAIPEPFAIKVSSTTTYVQLLEFLNSNNWWEHISHIEINDKLGGMYDYN